MEERTPDLQYNDQLMDRFHDQDEELYKVILQSRQEYLEQETKKQQRLLQKQQLEKKLAVPMSRLRLWQKTCSSEEEKTCLHYILQILFLSIHPDCDQDDIHIPPEHLTTIQNFLQQHFKASKLYTDVYKLCVEYFTET